MRSDEQCKDDAEVVHAQEMQVQDVHEPMVKIDAIHVASEVVDEVADEVVQLNVLVPDEVTATNLVSYVIVDT